MDQVKLIESAIAHEEWVRDNAPADMAHFWDGWTPEKVRAGQLVATVTTSARGSGHQVIVTRALVVQSVDGESLALVPDTEVTERVSSRDVRRAGGLEAYARKVAAAAYGAAVPVKAKHHP